MNPVMVDNEILYTDPDTLATQRVKTLGDLNGATVGKTKRRIELSQLY